MKTMRENQFIVTLLVRNQYGALTRVAGLFAGRGFNIDSLTVGETDDPDMSRMTIVSTGDEHVKNQVVLQLGKLVDVRRVELMDPRRTVARELLLVKIGVPAGHRAVVMEGVQVFRAKVVDLSPESLSIEITGEIEKIDAFLDYVRPYGIVEMCRTGATAIGRGEYVLMGEDPRAETPFHL